VRIAILEDDVSQTDLLSHWLALAGHSACSFSEGKALVKTLERDSFDALLLDWNVPDLSGLAVLNQVRSRFGLSTPVLFCTARGEEADLVAALRAGADDYVVKPMRRMELLARLEAVTRRSGGEQPRAEPFEVGIFSIDSAMRRLLRNGAPITLTPKDFDLAVLFLQNLGRLLSRAYIRDSVWNAAGAVSSRSLDTHVSRIRSKLGLTPEHGWSLSSVYGHGYRLEQLKPSGAAAVAKNPS